VRYITEHWEEKEIAVMDRWRIGSQVRELKPRVPYMQGEMKIEEF